jgi:nucleoside-diphosphate-sugar epimerase
VRVFLAGASGVIGRRLVPLLTAAGHQVTGMTRSPGKTAELAALGAEPVVCDVFDAAALTDAVVEARAEAVLHQLTDLPDDVASIAAFGSANARIRREGTTNLLAAAEAAGAGRFVAQSVAWTLPGDGAAAVDDLERMVLHRGGVVVRYGQFYGPGTFHEGPPPPPPRIHVDEAARRTLPALDAHATVLTIVED